MNALLNGNPLLNGIEAYVDPEVAKTKGEGAWKRGPGLRLALVFFDQADLDLFVAVVKKHGGVS